MPFPGRIPLDALDEQTGDYYYQKSNKLIGIGAFPLRPDQERHAEDGSMVVDVNSSEQALRHQIRQWLSDEEGREDLLNHAIPQKGLVYSDEPVNKGTFYLSLVDLHVNEDKNAILSGNGKCFYSGYKSVLSGVDFQKIKYFVPVENHKAHGYYQVVAVEAKDMSEVLAKEQEKQARSGKNLIIRALTKQSASA